MKRLMLALLLLAPNAALAAGSPMDTLSALCRTNPANSPNVMRAIVEAQLAQDHDPSLDSETPSDLAAAAVTAGVEDCAHDLAADTAATTAIAGAGPLQAIAWDAWNTTCADRKPSRGDCINAELGAAKAIRHMSATDQPPGSKAIAETCELLMQPDPALAEWRECIDIGLSAKAPPEDAKRCKLAVTWHSTKSGADAGAALGACLKGSGRK